MVENLELLNCLKDIPNVFQLLLLKKDKLAKDFIALFKSRDIKKIYFSGQASGAYIGKMLKQFIEDHFKIEVQIINPYEFVINESFNVNGIYNNSQLCMICPAHSGTTSGPIEMAKICRQLGICIVTTTYNLSSPLAKLSDVVIDKHSKAEKSYIETRGHFASMMCLYICFIEYGRSCGILDEKQYYSYYHLLETITSNIKSIIEETIKWYSVNKKILLDASVIRYIASGNYIGAGLEGGLKIAETTHKSQLFYEIEEFIHTGTTEINEESVIFLLAPQNKSYKKMLELNKWCRMYSEKVIVLCNKDADLDLSNTLKISSCDSSYFSVIEYTIPFEVIAYLLSEDLNRSVIHSSNEDNYDCLKVHFN